MQPLDLAPMLVEARKCLAPRPVLRLSEWANKNFYLSMEQSHGEGAWRSFPYQVGILDCMGSDEIEEVSFRKSARVGYTKMLLAAIGYFAEHKSRKQAVWNPTDSDSKEFVTNELDPMIRDVKAVRAAFPYFGQKNKHNTLHQKSFIGGPLYTRGGAASTNYRRITLDVAVLDEADAFESDLGSLGSPYSRAKKRVEGATFPKVIVGSTPGIKGQSLVDEREREADMRVTFRFPCPCCGERIALRWGGADEAFGMKWTDKNPETARQLCEECAGLFTQADYLEAWHAGRWEADDGRYLDAAGIFRDVDGAEIDAPRSIAFYLWTANSPQTSWATIVREFLAANKSAKKGDHSALKAFITETLGESWEEGGEVIQAAALQGRAESYEVAAVPVGVIVCTMAVDVQKDRLEYAIKGWGADDESWNIDYDVIRGDPAQSATWLELRDAIVSKLEREDGVLLQVARVFIDSGGLHTHAVYQFCRANAGLGVYAVKGHSQRGKPIIGRPSTVDVNHRGEAVKRGVRLYLIGTDTAKNLIYDRLRLKHPGPGYVHFSKDLPDEYYEQLTAEKRVDKYANGRVYRVWVLPSGSRNEALDLEVYNIAAAQQMGLHKWRPKKWEREAKRLAPKQTTVPSDMQEAVAESVIQKKPPTRRQGGFVNGWRK